VEQSHDERGIAWPVAIAPYEVLVIPLNMDSPAVVETAEEIYAACRETGLEALLDDRPDRAGSKFADADLIGIPWRIVVGDKGLQQGLVEVVERRTRAAQKVAPDQAVSLARERIEGGRKGG
jgi:prolyl-tRNA synthetase